MKYAWVENNVIRDTCMTDPTALFTPNVAALYSAHVPDSAQNGDGWDGVNLTVPVVTPAVLPPVPPIPPKVSPVEFKLLFTSAERIAIKTSTDAVVQDFFEIVSDPRLTCVDLGLQFTKDAIGYLQSKGLLTAERAAAILAGVLV